MRITMVVRTRMSKKTIGIKQADGSFYPIMSDGEPASKTLELTTVRDGQTAVKINLYKKYEESDEPEYVDTLLIENLIPHQKEEPTFSLSINLDEDNVLTAEVLDPETGSKSDTSVSLVTLSEAQMTGSQDFALADDTDIFDEKSDAFPDSDESSDLFNALADFDDEESTNDVTFSDSDDIFSDSVTETGDEAMDDFSTDSLSLGGDDFSFTESGDDIFEGSESTEEAAMDSFDPDSLSLEGDDFSFTESNDDIFEGSESTEEAAMDSFDPDSLSLEGDDFSFTESGDDIFEGSENTEEAAMDSFDPDSLSLGGDDFNFTESGDDIFEGSESTEEIAKDDFNTDSLSLDDDVFEFPENRELIDDTIIPDPAVNDFSENSIGLGEDDFSLADTSGETETSDDFSMDTDDLSDMSLDMDDTFASETNDFSEEATEASDDFSMGTDDFSDMSLDMEDTFASETNDFTEEATEASDDFSMGTDDFSDMSLDMDDTFTSETNDFSEEATETSDDFSMDTDDFSDMSLDMDDDFGSSDLSADSLDMSDDFGSGSLDMSGDFNLDSDTTIAETDSSFSIDDDFDDSFDNTAFSNTEETIFASNTTDDIQYADYGAQDSFQETEEMASSFVPPLYDEKLKDDIEKRRSRKKYPIAMIVCVLCTIICIIAVILAFAFGSWPSESGAVVNNVVTVEPPQVFEQERMEDIKEGKDVPPPAPEENTIEIVIEEEVVPVKPAPAPEKQSIMHLVRWGDTLWDLSDTYYRNPWLYPIIADKNALKNPDHIIAGTQIEIPPQ